MHNKTNRNSEYKNTLLDFIKHKYGIDATSITSANRGFFGETWKLDSSLGSFFVKLDYSSIHKFVYERSFLVVVKCMAVRNKVVNAESGIIDFDFMKYESNQRRIAEAETRLREEQRDSEQRLDATCKRIETKLDVAVERLDGKIDALDAKFEAKFEAMDAKFEAKFEAMDAKLDMKFSKLEGKFEVFQMWMMGLVITMVVGFVAMFLTIVLRT